MSTKKTVKVPKKMARIRFPLALHQALKDKAEDESRSLNSVVVESARVMLNLWPERTVPKDETSDC